MRTGFRPSCNFSLLEESVGRNPCLFWIYVGNDLVATRDGGVITWLSVFHSVHSFQVSIAQPRDRCGESQGQTLLSREYESQWAAICSQSLHQELAKSTIEKNFLDSPQDRGQEGIREPGHGSTRETTPSGATWTNPHLLIVPFLMGQAF